MSDILYGTYKKCKKTIEISENCGMDHSNNPIIKTLKDNIQHLDSLNRNYAEMYEKEKNINTDETENHEYIGDGVYAEFDGFGIWLRTGDHRDDYCDNKVYLEPDVLDSLNRFYGYVLNKRIKEKKDAAV